MVDQKKLKIAKKAFQTMWVAGTLGAFFTALTRNVPLSFKQFSRNPDVGYTLDQILRYGYLLWFLAYFFVSNLNNEVEEPENWDIPYDVLQSACALVAAFYLGFVVPGEGFGFGLYLSAIMTANAAILAICLFSLLCFQSKPWVQLDYLRAVGTLVSAVSFLIALFSSPGIAVLWIFIALQAILWVLLGVFVYLRLK